MNAGLEINSLTLDLKEILLRLLFAMLIGTIIGTEREFTHRPAGMRTHMLVALGSCTVMLTGQMIFCQYYPLGASPDPARLAAQVIAGVGFLGAGTILREGTSIKGLTTAASVWAVACLGVAVGAGFYEIGLIGTILMMVTLVVFERLQNWFVRRRDISYEFRVTASNAVKVMNRANVLAANIDAVLTFLQMQNEEEGTELHFKIRLGRRHYQSRIHSFFAELGDSEDVININSDHTVP